ncbi:hypothetical protein [Catellatospora citrea]|uniref:Uncharacterized protein n=1 Tax=Catellatospora citrea TaxID=53366 RepID=A0A8J3KP62_9ACTN|nr:hypothetical protein [Catellatospora citrea]RKE11628.1 hypothetical protein C8E86_6557 [Catellatospora citrea]GIG02234.1 hypothetical protein Cci01nite_73270 [Catellatospora citrea]
MGWKYHSPPGWPEPPEDWTPPAGWRPDPAWPPAPDDWQFWVSDGADDPTLMFELPDDEPFTSLDELIGNPTDRDRPVAGVPLSDPVPDAVPAWSAGDAAVEPAPTDVDPAAQPETVLVTAMEAGEPGTSAQAPPVAAAPAATAPDPVPALAAQTAMAMDAAAAPDAVWSDERPRPAWPVDPAMSAEPAWIAEPAPEPVLTDEPPPAWTDERAAPAWAAEPAMSAEPAWAQPAEGDSAAPARDPLGAAALAAATAETASPPVAGTPAEPAPVDISAALAPEPVEGSAEPVAAATWARPEPEPAATWAPPEPEPAATWGPPEPEPAPMWARPEPEPAVASIAGPEREPATVPAADPGPLAPEPVVSAPLTSGIAWPSPVETSSPEDPAPIAGVPGADLPSAGMPTAGVPLAGVPVMAFAAGPAAEPAGPAADPAVLSPDAAHTPAHAAGHVPAHAAPPSRRPWWVWGLAGAAGLMLCAVVGVGGFLAVRWGDGSPAAVADPSATAVGRPGAEPTQEAQGRPIPTPSRRATEALPQDQVFEGVGPQVVPVELGSTFHTVALTYAGTGPFVVRTVKADGQEIQTLVSAAESYEGVRPLDLGEIRPDAVSIQADGGWRMVVRPLASAQTFSGTASGVGADVLLIPRTAAESVKVAFDHRGTGKFTVQAIGSDSATLISQEGDFTGETMLPRGTVVVVIDTNGVWTFSRE